MSSTGTSLRGAISSFQCSWPGRGNRSRHDAKCLRRVVGADIELVAAMVSVVLNVVAPGLDQPSTALSGWAAGRKRISVAMWLYAVSITNSRLRVRSTPILKRSSASS